MVRQHENKARASPILTLSPSLTSTLSPTPTSTFLPSHTLPGKPAFEPSERSGRVSFGLPGSQVFLKSSETLIPVTVDELQASNLTEPGEIEDQPPTLLLEY